MGVDVMVHQINRCTGTTTNDDETEIDNNSGADVREWRQGQNNDGFLI
jgi:hypothetical protein